MNKEDIIKLFPLKGEITQDIIKNADRDDIANCVGALTLQDALGKELCKQVQAEWGAWSGSVNDSKGTWAIRLTTPNSVDFMGVYSPREVTFIIE